ncbi:hypothetical protein OWR28_16525 [Chryseobacterium sp. 1B4]
MKVKLPFQNIKIPGSREQYMANMSWQKRIKESIPAFSKGNLPIILNGTRKQRKLKGSTLSLQETGKVMTEPLNLKPI